VEHEHDEHDHDDHDEQDEPDRPFVGTKWVLVSIEGDVVEQHERSPWLAFDDEGRVSGTSGVNRVIGSYEVGGVGGDELRLSGMAGTRMAGPEEAMVLEQQFLAALGTGGTIAVDGDVLTLGTLAFVAE
jgi:heat shock protein HslJ